MRTLLLFGLLLFPVGASAFPSFDGTDDQIDVGQVTDPTTALSISAWGYLNGITDHDTEVIIAKRQTITLEPYITYFLGCEFGSTASCRATFGIDSGGITSSFIAISTTVSGELADRWHHWCATWSDSSDTQTLYIDGNLMGSESALSGALAYNASYQTYIGRSEIDGATGYWNGRIGEIAVYNVELTAAECKTLSTPVMGMPYQVRPGNRVMHKQLMECAPSAACSGSSQFKDVVNSNYNGTAAGSPVGGGNTVLTHP